MAKYITDILSELNTDPKQLVKYKDNNALKIIFDYAYNPEKKFILPEGDPPFKEDSAPVGMSPANLYQELRRLYVFCRKDLSAIRRETIFIQLLESLHPSEAKLILAIKDQKLQKLYPKLTHKVVFEAGFVSFPPTKESKTKVKNEEPSGVQD